MSRQEPIYIKNENSAIRNKDMFNVSVSSDLCIFSKPEYLMSGTTKIPCNELTCNFSGVSFDDIYSASTGTCNTVIVSASCISDITWSVNIKEDLTIVYSGDFYTQESLSASTPTSSVFLSEVNDGFESLGYIFTVDDDQFTIQRPYGTDVLDIDICLTYNQTDGCYSGTCSADCTTVCSETYNTISSGDTGIYIVSASTGNIDVIFDFTANTSSFLEDDTTFKYDVYKYYRDTNTFNINPVYQSGDVEWNTFSATSALTESIPVTNLNIDGDYLIKGYFTHNICTEFMGLLGMELDTSTTKSGDKFDLYDSTYDYLFIVIKEAEIPVFGIFTPQNELGAFLVNSFISDGSQSFNLSVSNSNSFLLSLNGSVLALNEDYTFSAVTNGGVYVTLIGTAISGDVLTYATIGTSVDDTVKFDIYDIDTTIVSGVTDDEGSENIYFNTDTGKYELFTTLTPRDNNNFAVTLNGVTLANNIDYYQSVTNLKRIILEGDLLVGDIINIFYPANPQVSGDINENVQTIGWTIPTAPSNTDGIFNMDVATDDDMINIVYTSQTQYVINSASYTSDVFFSGAIGTTLYYRVENEKRYESIYGDIILSNAFSEIVPITIQTNSFNSY